MSVQKQIDESVKELVKLSAEELEIQLGDLIRRSENEFTTSETLSAATATSPVLDAANLSGPSEFLRKLAHKFLKRFDRQLYRAVCDPNDKDHEKVKEIVSKGGDYAEKLALLLVGALAIKFMWLPAILAVVASLIARQMVEAGHEAVCDVWKERLDEADA